MWTKNCKYFPNWVVMLNMDQNCCQKIKQKAKKNEVFYFFLDANSDKDESWQGKFTFQAVNKL